MRAAFGFAAMLLALAALAAYAAEIEPTTYPFLPDLTMNNEPDVCGPFLAVVTEAFLGREFEFSLADQDWPEADVTPLAFSKLGLADPAKPHNLELTGVEIDLEGRRRILAHMVQPGPMRDDHGFLLFDDRAHYLDTLARIEASPAYHLNPDLIFEDARDVMPPEAPDETDWNGLPSWTATAFFRINGGTYVVVRNDKDDPTQLSLWRIEATASELACRVKISTPGKSGSLGHLAATSVGHLDATLQTISGQEPYASGSMHTLLWVQKHGLPVGSRVALRPWSAASFDAHNPAEDVRAWLDYWGHASLWNFRTFRKLEEQEKAASRELRDYYRDSFGLSDVDAQTWAARSIDVMLQRYFMFPATMHDLDLDNPRWRLRHALLAGRDWSEVEPLLASEGGKSGWQWFELEPAIVYALEHPALLERLLAANVDVRAKNGFGKTALMYAAHFNLVESAAVLIRHHADVNAATGSADVGYSDLFNGLTYRIDFWFRTALMYALENAGVDMVALLLDAGADPNARDSNDRDALDYLKLNTAIGSSAHREIEALLRKAGYRALSVP
jgi:hypothetical protein